MACTLNIVVGMPATAGDGHEDRRVKQCTSVEYWTLAENSRQPILSTSARQSLPVLPRFACRS